MTNKNNEKNYNLLIDLMLIGTTLVIFSLLKISVFVASNTAHFAFAMIANAL